MFRVSSAEQDQAGGIQLLNRRLLWRRQKTGACPAVGTAQSAHNGCLN